MTAPETDYRYVLKIEAENERLRAALATAQTFIGEYVQLPGHEHAALQALSGIEAIMSESETDNG